MFPWSSSPAWSHTSPPPATAPTWPPTSLPMTTSSRPTFEWPTTPSPPTHPTPHAGYSMDPHHHSMPPSAPSAPTSSSADHLFGHASTLHSTWPCTPSIPPTTSSSSPPTFSSLANSSPILQHHTFPPTPTTARIDVPTYPTPTMNFVAHTGPSFSGSGAPCLVPAHAVHYSPTCPTLPTIHQLLNLRFHLNRLHQLLPHNRHHHRNTLQSKPLQRCAPTNDLTNLAEPLKHLCRPQRRVQTLLQRFHLLYNKI